MSEELSRVEDLLANGVEEPVEPMSEVEAILRGENPKPHSRVSDLLLNYNPGGSVLIEKTVTENGTYIARNDNADGYSKIEVDIPVPQPVTTTLTVTENGTYTPPSGVDGYSSVEVDVAPEPLQEYYLTNGKVGTTVEQYISIPLDISPMTNGIYKVVLRDATYSATIYGSFVWNGSTVSIRLYRDSNNYYDLQITSTTAGLIYWDGAWRDIYADIIKVADLS